MIIQLLQYQCIQEDGITCCLAYEKTKQCWRYYRKETLDHLWWLSQVEISDEEVKRAFKLQDEDLTYIKLRFSV